LISNEPWALVADLQRGDPAAVEPTLAYLELDPWAFRTGYVKDRLLRHLHRHDLAAPDRGRIDVVLLRYADVGPRSEFGTACRLARQAGTPQLGPALIERLRDDDIGVVVRSLRMLMSIRLDLDTHELDTGREALHVWIGSHRNFSPTRWVTQLARYLWSPTWQTALAAEASEGPLGLRQEGARLLLGMFDSEGTDPSSA